jgi:hypothetical protein
MNTYKDVTDPAAKLALIQSRNKDKMANAATYEDILASRDSSINDLVKSYTSARNEDTATENAAWTRKMDMENLALKRAELAATNAHNAIADDPNKDFNVLVEKYGYEKALRIYAAMQTGGTYSDIEKYLPKTSEQIAEENRLAQVAADKAAASQARSEAMKAIPGKIATGSANLYSKIRSFLSTPVNRP